MRSTPLGIDTRGILASDAGTKQVVSAQTALRRLLEGRFEGEDLRGWLDLPATMMGPQLEHILQHAQRIREAFDTTLVLGVGGSYHGAKALLDALADQRAHPEHEVIFLGFTLCPDFITFVLDRLRARRVHVIVISKSGTTLETDITFRLVKARLRGTGLAIPPGMITVVTDTQGGALLHEARSAGYAIFQIPSSVGGRFSVLSAVGLLPLAVAGVDANDLLRGAYKAQQASLYMKDTSTLPILYAASRHRMSELGRHIELFCTYTPFLQHFEKWFAQLFGETEGKDQQGIFPATANLTTDLHSIGQFLQEGRPLFFETHLVIGESLASTPIPSHTDSPSTDNLARVPDLGALNRIAARATMDAHRARGTESITLHLIRRDAYHMGYLVYSLELCSAISALMQGSAPFNQPGVEQYKHNIQQALTETRS